MIPHATRGLYHFWRTCGSLCASFFFSVSRKAFLFSYFLGGGFFWGWLHRTSVVKLPKMNLGYGLVPNVGLDSFPSTHYDGTALLLLRHRPSLFLSFLSLKNFWFPKTSLFRDFLFFSQGNAPPLFLKPSCHAPPRWVLQSALASFFYYLLLSLCSLKTPFLIGWMIPTHPTNVCCRASGATGF